MYYYDSTMLIVLPGLLLALYAQSKIKSTFAKYKKVSASSGITAAQAAADILARGGITDVRIEQIAGELTDHYDPRDKVLRLSQSVHDSTSIAALGVAAHEAGHALQHAQDYFPLTLRNQFVPIANFGSNAAIPLFFIGMLFSWQPIILAGILFFAFAVIFSLVTLPVEFNASSRALLVLSEGGYLSQEETQSAGKVLNAAALTYVASAVNAVLQLLRLVALSQSRRRRD